LLAISEEVLISILKKIYRKIRNGYLKAQRSIASFVFERVERRALPGSGATLFLPEGVFLEGIKKALDDWCASNFEEADEIWSQGYSLSIEQSWEHRIGYQIFKEYFEGRVAKKTVLDAGCSVGNFAGFLKSLGWLKDVQYFGFDIEAKLVQAARSFEFQKSEFSVGDLLTLKGIEEKRYDIVHSQGVLINLHSPDLGLKNLINLTGKYLVLTHTAMAEDELFKNEDNGRFISGLYGDRKGQSLLITVLKKSWLIDTLKQNGFKVSVLNKRREGLNYIMKFGRYDLYDIVCERK
jgi:SAM-dependent methyltransferase